MERTPNLLLKRKRNPNALAMESGSGLLWHRSRTLLLTAPRSTEASSSSLATDFETSSFCEVIRLHCFAMENSDTTESTPTPVPQFVSDAYSCKPELCGGLAI